MKRVSTLLILSPTLFNNSSNIFGGILRKLKNDIPSVTLPSIYHNVQTTVLFPQKTKTVPNMICVVFYVASFVSLSLTLQFVNLEGLVVLEVANDKACICDSFFNILMQNYYLNSVFYTEYMSIVHTYWEPVENVQWRYQDRDTVVLQSSATSYELITVFENVVWTYHSLCRNLVWT